MIGAIFEMKNKELDEYIKSLDVSLKQNYAVLYDNCFECFETANLKNNIEIKSYDKIQAIYINNIQQPFHSKFCNVSEINYSRCN